MANTIKFKRASGSDPSASDLAIGEPGLRTDTAELFFKKDDGTVAKVSGGGGGPNFKYLELRNAANNGAASFPGNDFTLVTAGTTTAITPVAANTLLVSVSGVIQKPNSGTSTSGITGFIVDGSRFKTATNLPAAPDFIVYQESGGIGEPSDNTVTSAKIVDGAIVNADINASAAIAGSKLADNSISLAKLEHGTSSNDGKFLRANNGADPTFETIDLTSLSASNLTSGTIPDARFPATLPAASAANLTSIPAGNLTGALPAIDGSNLTGITIEASELANNAVDTNAIQNQAVTTSKLANDAVDYGKLADSAVLASKLANNSVQTAKIVDEAVTLAKLEHGTSSNDGKFLRANNGADPTFETVTGTTINNNADNRIITGSGTANTLNAESTLTYSSNTLLSTSNNFVIKSIDTNASNAENFIQFNAGYITYDSDASNSTGNSGHYFQVDGSEKLRINNSGQLVFDADTNTHLARPAADTFAFTTNGTERMRIDSDGNVGIGTTSASTRLHVENSNDHSSTWYLNGDAQILVDNTSSHANARSILKLENNAALVYGDGSGSLRISDRENIRMEIDSSGRLLVGVTSPPSADIATALTIKNPSSSSEHTFLDIVCDDNESARILFSETSNNSNGSIRYNFLNDSRVMTFHTDGNTERMRILSGGGITFNGDTAAANALDDYEEGTWTPVFINVNTPTFNSQTGRYTKIGRFIYLTGILDVASGLDTNDGSAVGIGGLPFTGNSDHNSCLFSFGKFTNLMSDSRLETVTNFRFNGTNVMLHRGSNHDINYKLLNSSGKLEFAMSYSE